MAEEFDFANAANWEQISHTVRFADQPSLGHFTPIPEFDASGAFPLNAPILATYALCSSAKPTWNTAGWLYQNVRAGIAEGGSYNTSVSGSRRVPLKRVEILFWQRNIKDYKLSFKCPKWINQLTLTVWQYIGTYSDTTQEAIDLARIDILRTEAKVDALFREWTQ